MGNLVGGWFEFSGQYFENVPVYNDTAVGSDAALYWYDKSEDLDDNQWIFHNEYTNLTREEKAAGIGCAKVTAVRGAVPLGSQPLRCFADGKWLSGKMTVRLPTLSEAVAREEERSHQAAKAAAVGGFVQGLSYQSTRRVDLSGPDFGNVTAVQIKEIARHCPDLEALFLLDGTVLDESTLVMLRRACPRVKCLALGCDVTEEGYLELLAQHGKHDAELAAVLSQPGLPEGMPPGVEPQPEPEAGSSSGDICRVLDLTGSLFAGLTDAGLAEIPIICPDIMAVFMPTGTRVTHAGLDEFRRQSPGVCCLSLGVEVERMSLLLALRGATATQTLDLTGEAYGHMSNFGLRELVAICLPEGQLRAVIFPERLKPRAEIGLAELQSLHLSAHFVQVGDEITLQVGTAAEEARSKLDALQEQLRSSTAAEPTACEARDVARLEFIAAVEAFSAALHVVGDGSAFFNHVATQAVSGYFRLPANDMELPKWQRVQAKAEQLAVFAAECKRIVEVAEPNRSAQALAELQDKHQRYRQLMKTSQARIDIAEGQASSSPRSRPALETTTTTTSPEQQQARVALLTQPIEDWSEAQVQQWISIIGLSPDRVELVQRALAENETDGEDLEDMKKKRLQKMLQKVHVDAEDAAELAEQTITLHEAALGEAPAQGKVAAAQSDLAEARKSLRSNQVAMRSLVVHLVSLASQHFPELKEHKDVRVFMGSDGLEASDYRRLADYEEIKPLVNGRNELLRAKYEGAAVCLKVFSVQGDMQAYAREFLRVQRLHHPYIISYTAAFEDNGSMYLQMEYMKHGSLRHWLETTNPDVAQKRSVLRQALLALACVHSQGIVHSDIKGEVRV